jgi:hypothetical protein
MVVCSGRLSAFGLSVPDLRKHIPQGIVAGGGSARSAGTRPAKMFVCSGIPELFKKTFYNNNHAHDEENSSQ